MPKTAKPGEATAAFAEPERGVGSKGRTGSKVQSAFDGDYESTLFRTGQQADAKHQVQGHDGREQLHGNRERPKRAL